MNTLLGLIVEPQNLEVYFSTGLCSKRLKQRPRLFEPLLMAPAISKQLALSGYPLSTNIKKAFEKCLKTLRRINKEGVNKDTEFVLIDRVCELNYRILGRYLNRKIKRETLEYLQKVNYFIQGIICSDVKNLDKHYELNKKQ